MQNLDTLKQELFVFCFVCCVCFLVLLVLLFCCICWFCFDCTENSLYIFACVFLCKPSRTHTRTIQCFRLLCLCQTILSFFSFVCLFMKDYLKSVSPESHWTDRLQRATPFSAVLLFSFQNIIKQVIAKPDHTFGKDIVLSCFCYE